MIFSVDKLETDYRDNGYVVVPLLDEHQLKELAQVWRETDPQLEGAFYCSNWIADAQARRSTHLRIQKIVEKPLNRLMPGYQSLYSCFITKRRSWHGKVFPHIDWQFVPEPEHVAFNVWMPLKRTFRFNGAMWVVPGSHLRTNARRGPNIEIPVPDAWLEGMRTLSLSAGEALIYDTRLIHGSYPNWISSQRTVLASIMVPAGEPVIHNYLDPQTEKITTYQVDSDFYLERCRFRKDSNVWPLSDI